MEFTPKLVSLNRAGLITRAQVGRDLMSGLIVGIVALPLAIAFAIASGVSPDKGLVTAIVAGLVIALLGGSRVQVSGPSGAFVIIIFGIVQEHGVTGLTVATLLAGFLIMGMGFARLGNYLKFVPYPLIVGFTSGIAVVIFSTQIKDFFGLRLEEVPPGFVSKWIAYGQNLHLLNPAALVIAVLTVVVTFQFHRVSKKIPGSLVAIVLSTVAVQLLDLPVETISSRFGGIPRSIPWPSLPEMNLPLIKELIQPAISIALLGSIESLLSAVVSDGMIGSRHRSNIELVAQGVGNVFSALFGGIPATGAIARTATNVRNGGRTPIAAVTHAVFLLLAMLLLAPLVRWIPMACLAGILVVVSYHMSEWKSFVQLLRSNRMDVLVLVITFVLTVFFDLILAIEVGLVLSSLLFMKRMSEATRFGVLSAEQPGDEAEADSLFEEELPRLSKGIELYEINGPLFFGASHKFGEFLRSLEQHPRVLILRMRHVPFIDATGTKRLQEFVSAMKTTGTTVLVSGAGRPLRQEFLRAGLYPLIGRRHILPDIGQAVARAEELLRQPAVNPGRTPMKGESTRS